MSTVLLVDDSKTILLSLSQVLTKSGYTVETAGDGKEALGRLDAGVRPNLVITDLNMPVMDGLTFVREARRRTATRFTPILVLTTESQEAKRAEARQAGATGWLVKPVQPADLLATMQKVLAR